MSNISPYAKFKNWLFDNNPDSELDEITLKSINPLPIMAMFGTLNEVTIYINDTYNNFDTLKYDHYSFYKMLKEIVIKNNIQKYNLSFFTLKKEKNKYKHMLDKFPFLKKDEINMLVETVKDDHFKNLVKEKKYKTKKLSKKDLKDFENDQKAENWI